MSEGPDLASSVHEQIAPGGPASEGERQAELVSIDPGRTAFAHESEAELARILDFYAVRWQYEPHRYPILWDLDGNVLESFSPDFYLPDLDMYVELTTLKQRLVRKKNRKLRRLRELYGDIRIKLFYARDFRMLMLKYGKVALVDGLSGSSGQVVPPPRRPRTIEVPLAEDAVRAAAALPSRGLSPTADEPSLIDAAGETTLPPASGPPIPPRQPVRRSRARRERGGHRERAAVEPGGAGAGG